jgi:2-epi-5-epi-valiolone synthase
MISPPSAVLPAPLASPRDDDRRPPLEMNSVRKISYKIHHPNRPVFDLDELTLVNLVGRCPTLLIIDDAIWQQYAGAIAAYAERHLNCAGVHCISGSEKDKTLDGVSAICRVAAEAKLPRRGTIVGIGGGVVLDVAGLAATIYRRGVSYVRVPTSLIGIVDVGVGIKHGVNFCGKKNLLGSFFPPYACVNDKRFLQSLPCRHVAAGIAEIIKIAVVADPELFSLLERFGARLAETRFQSIPDVADEVLIRAEAAMIDELSHNLFEDDLKRLSDFGHTFSPMLEMESHHSLVHGEAVALDMLVSVAISVEQGVCDSLLLTRLIGLYREVGLPTVNRLLEPPLLMAAAAETRAHRAGALNLVVPRDVGSSTFVQHLSFAHVEGALRVIGALI